ncbi:DEAD/DEAH box helicase family protein [Candidatus Poriferisodalis sp.]|uniref:DEAD/DEAH box helicase family protein n=1 Tax=Candidatus Poriferisodalis sp. TaxID=3101277 RepID=UPI003B52559C
MTGGSDRADVLERASETLEHYSPQSTDGTWLEDLTVEVAPFLADWDVEVIYPWAEWPSRVEHFPNTTKQDIGIDLVAHRRSDDRPIAVQCKARKLDPDGAGAEIGKGEVSAFSTPAANDLFAERWLVTNGANPLNANAENAIEVSGKPIKLVNLTADLTAETAAAAAPQSDDECPHCAEPANPEATQTRTCMQREAVEHSVRILREHAEADSGGLPKGQARGRIILPCGAGKTRIALRIVEELTEAGHLSVVLCPSIALVAQLRREFLQNAESDIRAMAVCSDQTAGYDPKKEGSAKRALDPTQDNSNVSATEIKGLVTTDPEEIAAWIADATNVPRISVIFGTYQSASRVAEALGLANADVQVLVCDEAHRTAALRRHRKPDEQARLQEFTLCHDQQAFPARYRIYQTATPRIYNHTTSPRRVDASEFVVRSMDDETIFGVELYRKSYVEAVRNGWLSDYRIIALGVNDPEAFAAANELARTTESKGKSKLTTVDYLRGLALVLVMGGATRSENEHDVTVESCIAFMNTVDKSKNMMKDLQTDAVRDWLASRMEGTEPATFTLEHLDATYNVAKRDNAKQHLAAATADNPHGIVNVGIFGEGTDSPSLSAVAFLEPRKSPIDVVQAVGRAMRTAPGKKYGYIICPILIPPNDDPERWLTRANPEEGWSELGQILLALRAHDSRIEEELADMMQVYVPPPQLNLETTSLVGVASASTGRIRYGEHRGPTDSVFEVIEAAAAADTPLSQHGLMPVRPEDWTPDTEPTQIVTVAPTTDGALQLRHDTVVRNKPKATETIGQVDAERTKKHARKMINNGEGKPVPSAAERKKRAAKNKKQKQEEHAQQMLELIEGEFGTDITVNLLAKSGLRRDRVSRDLNVLEESVNEAAHHLRQDGLKPALDAHFGLDQLAADKRSGQADGCTIAALLLMNAAMLHQRIAAGGWLRNIESLSEIKNDPEVVERLRDNWQNITRQDFLPVIDPAMRCISAVRKSGKLAGLERALRHLTAEAERIAETYADMGADHAGPLFNKVMGNQASDGAYFTRPPAATMAARLSLDACGDQDWTDPATWRAHKAVDLACGSGTLLAALLTEMKRRAREQGALPRKLADLQKLAVEDVLKGMDINSVSLQLAATQLTAGNTDIKYSGMGLYEMPYGPTGDPMVPIAAGTLELLAEDEVVPRSDPEMFANSAQGSAVKASLGDPEVERAARTAIGARIAIMNPPFSERERMGQKFPNNIQMRLRDRVDGLESTLVGMDPALDGFVSKRSLAPMFVALAERCVSGDDGVLAMLHPTIALANHSGLVERRILASRFAVDTILTCHQPGNINLSQNTNINESIIVLRRMDCVRPPTRIIALDRFPNDDAEVIELFEAIEERGFGVLADSWGEVSEWPSERVRRGDWTAAIWRSPLLAEAAAQFAEHPALSQLSESGVSARLLSPSLTLAHKRASAEVHGAFPILKSKGAGGQLRIAATPDEHWVHMRPGPSPVLNKAGYLLVTAGQDTSTARLTAVASGTKHVGHGWMPVVGFRARQAKAAAVYLNSTPGRLLLMRNPGRKLNFPTYRPAVVNGLPVPDLSDSHTSSILADCWAATRRMPVPQFRDGECEVREIWDAAVCEAVGWDKAEIAGLRQLLHAEPHVRGLAYGQFSD